MANTKLAFRCTIELQDLPTNLTGRVSLLQDMNTFEDTIGKKRLLGEAIYKYLRLGPVRGPETRFSIAPGGKAYSRRLDYAGDELFHYAIGRKDSHEAERWLAYYIANNIGIKLGYLNEILRRMQTQGDSNNILTILEVKWWRVVGTLGGLLIFQIAFACMGVVYCHNSMEVSDEVSTFSDMFARFPFISTGQQPEILEGAEYGGEFVPDPDNLGYMWVFGKKDN